MRSQETAGEHTGQGDTSLQQSQQKEYEYQYKWLCVSREVSMAFLSCSWAGSLLVLVFPGILVALSPCLPLPTLPGQSCH